MLPEYAPIDYSVPEEIKKWLIEFGLKDFNVSISSRYGSPGRNLMLMYKIPLDTLSSILVEEEIVAGVTKLTDNIKNSKGVQDEIQKVRDKSKDLEDRIKKLEKEITDLEVYKTHYYMAFRLEHGCYPEDFRATKS